MAFRAFFALPAENFQTSTGVYTNAVYGFTSMMLKLMETEQPTHMAVAFDLPGGTFRTKEYSEYKAGRDATPEEFKGQIELIQQVLSGMGIEYLTKDNYEADDILATLAYQGNQAGWRVLVASGDRDSFQMVTDNVTVIYPGASTADLRFMTPQAVEDKYGVSPARYPELAALVGESADNLPGVPGVGPKTAAQWLAKFNGLDNLLASADKVTGKRGEALREHVDDVLRNRRLNHLLIDLPLDKTIADLQRQPVNRQLINELFDALEFNTLRKRVFAVDSPARSTQPGQAAATSYEQQSSESGRPAASVFGKEHYGTELPALELPPAEDIVERVTMRTLDIHPLDEAVLASLAEKASQGDDIALRFGCLPAHGSAGVTSVLLAHGTIGYGANLTDLSPAAFNALIALTEKYGLFVHDGKSEWHSAQAWGITLATPALDTQLAAYLLQQDRRSANLDSLVHDYLANEDWSAGESDDDGALFTLDTDESALTRQLMVLGNEAAAILDLAPVLQQKLSQVNAESLLADVELPVQTLLARMEKWGIAVDSQALSALSGELQRDVDAAQSAAWAVLGEEVNLSSPKQLQVVLFDTLGLPKTKKTKTGYTTNADALVSLFEKTAHPFLEHLLVHRDRIKLKQMVETLRSSVADDQRIHSTFSQVTAATGRLASSDPNLQNIPTRTEEGRRIRATFVCGRDYEALMSADYSQIEMRIMAHMSADQGLIEAFNSGEDLHTTMAAMVFGVPVGQVTSEQRSRTKATSYGLAYGLSPFGLSQQLGISVAEASALRDRYFERFGGVQNYLHSVVAQARKDGFTSTMLGRRRYLPDLNSANRQRREIAERAALNAPIQGTAADIMKMAMLNVQRALDEAQLRSRSLVQIHDELLIEIAPGETAQVREIVVHEMTNAVSLDVPLNVAVGVGQSWLDAAH